MSDMDNNGDDLHKMVMKGAFEEFKNRRELIVVNGVININKNVLMLFSPLLRDIITTIPSTVTEPTSVILPETNLKTVLMMQELLSTGACSKLRDVGQTKEMMETLKSLGIDITNLLYGKHFSDQNNIEEIDLSKNNAKEAFANILKAGKEVVLTLGNSESPSMSPRQSRSPTNIPAPMIIKKEKVVESEEEQTPAAAENNVQPAPEIQQMTEKEPQMPILRNQTQSTADPAPAPPETQNIKEPSDTDVKNQCEKCKKAFDGVNQLKNHYCGHFLSILKKKFASSYKDDKCLECNKKFPNLQRLLVHLGVIHDKINIILKIKGLRELPPFSLTSAEPKKDIKKPPVMPPTIAQTPVKSTPAPGIPSPAAPPQTPVSAPPPPPAVPQTPVTEKRKLDEECNFDLQCQVCKQKQNSLYSLEQHLSRHFMKEIQDKFAHLMDDLKCALCHSIFKQKHSLVMHIGCKHGKINEILKEKNFQVLPAPILSNPSSSMQKKLQMVKKERFDSDSNVEAPQQEETLMETTSGTSENTEIDKILKKYNFSASLSK